MIEYISDKEFDLMNQDKYTDWINKVIIEEGYKIGELCYIFTSDEELHKINKKFLKHDTLTDIITFNYNNQKEISGDIFISLDRVKDNASIYSIDFDSELKRVMIHGVLHLLGYQDKKSNERQEMRRLENEKMKMFHVEQ
jgi:rRNA maturation RNase YbeY